ncbi:MAG: hydroxyacid dehydrogenase [Candidatus Adiutrix sp.]|nr:hydroxyacid dehydrogenase [Candidatus Adiutrix sp.]
MTKILICEKIDPICPEMFRAAGFEVEVSPGLEPERLRAAVAGCEGLVVRSAVRVTAELMDAADRLKVVGRAGAGLDTIDVEAARARGITVLNTPGQNAGAVAELVLGLMLALTRRLVPAHVALAAGRWEKNRLSGFGFELGGKTLGLVGFGAVGRRVAALVRGFDMEILVHDPLVADGEVTAAGARPSGLTELLAAADFLSLHLPLTSGTRNLISREVIFSGLKPGAVLINCARGGLVDEAALAEALAEGRLAGAGLDVFEKEPPSADNPLLALENVVVTPHLGASTAESQVNVARSIAGQMIEHLK